MTVTMIIQLVVFCLCLAILPSCVSYASQGKLSYKVFSELLQKKIFIGQLGDSVVIRMLCLSSMQLVHQCRAVKGIFGPKMAQFIEVPCSFSPT